MPPAGRDQMGLLRRCGALRGSQTANEDDAASDAALDVLVDTGALRLVGSRQFTVAFYWTNVDDMLADMAARWTRRHEQPGADMIAAARQGLAAGRPDGADQAPPPTAAPQRSIRASQEMALRWFTSSSRAATP